MAFFVIAGILCGELKWDIIHTAEPSYFIICKLYHYFIHESGISKVDSLYNIGKLCRVQHGKYFPLFQTLTLLFIIYLK